MIEVVPMDSIHDLSAKFEERGVREFLHHQLQQNPIETHQVLDTVTICQYHDADIVDGVCKDCCDQEFENEDTDDEIDFSYLDQGLRISRSETDRLRRLESKNQLSQKKLHLVLDIDGTLIHSFRPRRASELGLSKDQKDTREIDGFVVKLRPMVLEFLERASTLFQMYIYTLGTRPYAEDIAEILDPQGIYFGRRIISRDDNALGGIQVKTLDLVVGKESNILIVDDNSTVWPMHHRNLISIKQYVFTGKETDEIEMKAPCLMKVLNVLRAIHSAFFEEKVQGKKRCCTKDVRKLLAAKRGCKTRAN